MVRFIYGALALCSFVTAQAEIIGGFDPQSLVNVIEQSTDQLQRQANDVPDFQRRRLANQIDRVVNQLQRVSRELNQGGGGGGHFGAGWFQANAQECVSFCRSQGMFNAISPEGAQCVSGENQAMSAVGRIVYTYGTWGGGPQHQLSAQSNGGYCYKPGQGRDNDRTDLTVGCFCRR